MPAWNTTAIHNRKARYPFTNILSALLRLLGSSADECDGPCKNIVVALTVGGVVDCSVVVVEVTVVVTKAVGSTKTWLTCNRVKLVRLNFSATSLADDPAGTVKAKLNSVYGLTPP